MLLALLFAAAGCGDDDGSGAPHDTLDVGAGVDSDSEADTANPDDGDAAPTDEGTVDVDVANAEVAVDTGPPPPVEFERLPLGASGDLHRIRFLGDEGFVAVGADGTVLTRYGPAGWVRAWTPAGTPALRDVAVGASGAHAVGDGGTWLTRNSAGAWLPWDAVAVDADLTGLATLEGGAVLAVGQDGTVLRRDAGGLTFELNEAGVDLLAVAATGPHEAFAVGAEGKVWRRIAKPGTCPFSPTDNTCAACTTDTECDGGLCRPLLGDSQLRCTSACDGGGCPAGLACAEDEAGESWCKPPAGFSWFEDASSVTDATLHAVYALDPTNVWAVGDGGVVVHFGSAWTVEETTDSDSRGLHAIAGGAGRLLAVGDAGAFLRRTSESTWGPVADLVGPLLTERRYEGIAIGGDEIIAVGEAGAMQLKQLPGGAFVDATSQPSATIRDLVARGDTAVGVGDHGLVVWLDESGHGALTSGTAADLYGAWLDGEDRLWVAGAGGTILRRSPGGKIDALASGTTADLHAVAALEDGTVVLVGQAGVALRVDGTPASAKPEPTPTSLDLLDVFEDAAGSAVAVGEQGTILRRDAGGWHTVPVPAAADLHAGVRVGDHVVVVGAQGTVVLWPEGGTPTVTIHDPATVYLGASALGDSAAVLVGWSGVLHRLELGGGAPAKLESPTAASLYAVVADSDGALLVGGLQGELWRQGPGQGMGGSR